VHGGPAFLVDPHPAARQQPLRCRVEGAGGEPHWTVAELPGPFDDRAAQHRGQDDVRGLGHGEVAIIGQSSR
jgi:hypothetical protein